MVLILTSHIKKDVILQLILACSSVTFLHCLVGSVSSAITVVVLYRRSYRQDDEKLVREKQKSAVTILLMNLPHFVTSACIFTSMVSPQGISWFDINYIFCPILTATLNPLFIVTRSAATRKVRCKMVRAQVRKLATFRGIRNEMNAKGTEESGISKNSHARQTLSKSYRSTNSNTKSNLSIHNNAHSHTPTSNVFRNNAYHTTSV